MVDLVIMHAHACRPHANQLLELWAIRFGSVLQPYKERGELDALLERGVLKRQTVAMIREKHNVCTLNVITSHTKIHSSCTCRSRD